MGCQSSKQPATQKKTTNSVMILTHSSFIFTTNSQTNGTIIVQQQNDTKAATHLVIEEIKPNSPSNFAKGFYSQNQSRTQMPVKLPAGYYRLHVIMNWDSKQGQVDVSFNGNTNLSFKKSETGQKNQTFYDCMTEQCRKKGKTVKNDQEQFVQSLYHEPQSNLVIIAVLNKGQRQKYNLNLKNTKSQNDFKLLNQRNTGDQQWLRGAYIDKNFSYTWIIAPKVQFSQRNVHAWEVKDAVLGQSKQCAMMEFGSFNRPVNPPPDVL